MKPFKTCLRPDGEHHGKKRDKQPSLRHIHCSDSHAEAATEVPHFAGRTRVAVLAGIAVRRVENLLLGWHSSFGAVLREDKSGFAFMWGPCGGMVRLWSIRSLPGFRLGLGLGAGFEDTMQEEGGMDSPSSTHMSLHRRHYLLDTKGHRKNATTRTKQVKTIRVAKIARIVIISKTIPLTRRDSGI